MHGRCHDWHFYSPCAKEASLTTAPWDNILQYVATKLHTVKNLCSSRNSVLEEESPMSHDDETCFQRNFFTCQQVPLMLGACLTFSVIHQTSKFRKKEIRSYFEKKRKRRQEKKKQLVDTHAQHIKCTNFTRRFPAVELF